MWTILRLCGASGQRWKYVMSTSQNVINSNHELCCLKWELFWCFSNFEAALKLMQTAVTPPVRRADYYDQSEPVQNRVYKSLKVWSMYADLEESIGTFQVHAVTTLARFLCCLSIDKT